MTWTILPAGFLAALLAGPAFAQTSTPAPAAPFGTAAGQVSAAEPAAVFPFELDDSSGEGPRPGQAERLAMATRILDQLLEKSGRYKPVDLAPLAAEVEATAPRYGCNACWADVARKAGAKVAVLPFVHKVSTLISTMHVWIYDLASKQFTRHLQGQIRGDTDTAYRRGIEFLVDDQLLKP